MYSSFTLRRFMMSRRFSTTRRQLRAVRFEFSIDPMITSTFFHHTHKHHGLTGRGALLRVHVRL